MTHGIFVTGTDTGVGKTVVTAALLRRLAAREVSVVGLKPVATGCVPTGPDGVLRNDDALELQAASSVRLAYEDVNPCAFAPAVAPHLAAREVGRPIDLGQLLEWYPRVTSAASVALVEGAGGWRVPLHPRGFLSDLPEALGLEVVLVVGLRLGCLNHARLTAESIAASGRCRLAGWVANGIDPGFERREENLGTLVELLGSEPLAVLPWLGDAPRSPHGNPVGRLGVAPALDAWLDRVSRR